MRPQDPAAEYAAWKVRELRRLKREREAIEARERERAEVERRRNLSEAERQAEDEAFLARQREEKEGRGSMAYLQKYHHKGAFYRSDNPEAEALASRDIMGARFADDVQNRELLPKALQLRDMTKLGRKGATKYRDLKSEDTGAWGDHLRRDYGRPKRGGGGGEGDFDSYHVDDRFKSDRERERSGPGGANAIPLGERKGGGVPGAPDGPKHADRRGGGRDGDRYRDREREQDREHGRDNYRSRDDDYRRRDRRSRSRSRSRSPRRHGGRDGYHGSSSRKRDSSRDTGRHESDKRRRVEAR